MNVNDLVEAFGLPRYYADRLPAGASLVATVKHDGSIRVEIVAPGSGIDNLVLDEHGHVVGIALPAEPTEQKRGPGRPRKTVSESSANRAQALRPHRA